MLILKSPSGTCLETSWGQMIAAAFITDAVIYDLQDLLQCGTRILLEESENWFS